MTSSVAGTPVVVGIDGSHSARRAADWAADEAARHRAPLRLVYAVGVPPLGYGGRAYVDELAAVGQDRLAETGEAVRERYPALEIETDLRMGNPVPELVEQSQSARMVVLGSRGLGGFTGLLVGSTAVAVAAHGHCPVAVIHGLGPIPPVDGPIVVGVDGSPASEPAIGTAFDEAAFRRAELVAVHSWLDFSSDIAYAYARQFVLDWNRVQTEEEQLLAERLAGWQEKYPDVRVRRVVTTDRPAKYLLEQAVNAQLLIVGSRGRGGLSGSLLGSTSQALIYHSPCPVLVVRGQSE